MKANMSWNILESVNILYVKKSVYLVIQVFFMPLHR